MSASPAPPPSPSNFLRHIIDRDLETGRFQGKHWSPKPGFAAQHAQGQPDPACIRTRFPPEPNGYLHIGHAKSICLNFGLAQAYGGTCHLRFDDTNPEKEDQKYVNAICEALQWLGFDWKGPGGQEQMYFASDYFEYMYTCAQKLIEAGYAYVDAQNAEAIRLNRGTLTQPGQDSPWRNRPAEESLQILEDMRAGRYQEGEQVLRARIDMGAHNINLRDPILYRVRYSKHYRTDNQWCLYPTYIWAHPIEDALEGITHSICTLEFEDQRPVYNWILQRLAELHLFAPPLPQQYEFARLNLTYIVTSKRKLMQLVQEGHVNGWDDPRMPTLLGMRRRGYPAAAIRLFCERTGVSKSDSRIDYSVLEGVVREVLDPEAPRVMAVLHPLKLIITNYPATAHETCVAPINPHQPDQGERRFSFGRELWIAQEDFQENPSKKYFRLFPGNTVRLKYGYVVRCTGCRKDQTGQVVEVYAEYLPDTKSGTPGANSIKVKSTLTWVSAQDAIGVTLHLYDRLFTDPDPDTGDKDFLQSLNPHSQQTVQGWLEPGTCLKPEVTWQFERLGYFTLDARMSAPDKPVIHRVVTLRDVSNF